MTKREPNPDESGVQITGLKKEKYNLEKHDMEIYGHVKRVRVREKSL